MIDLYWLICLDKKGCHPAKSWHNDKHHFLKFALFAKNQSYKTILFIIYTFDK
jgi:hypothetical protein